MDKGLIMLMILDGFGISDYYEADAVQKANTPNLDYLMQNCPHTEINASGLFVGLPDGQMGNSEVGHTNIGAGRIVYQDLTKITKAIEDGDFFSVPEFKEAIKRCREKNSNLHVMGLVSDGGVHSHINHLFGLIDLCKRENFDRLFIHAFTDGRDTSPKSGINYIKQLEEKISEAGVGKIVSVSGRYYAMDRDKRWERVEKAYKAIAEAEGSSYNSSVEAVNDSYNNDVTDEFIVPCVIDGGQPIEKDDSVIFFNFRPDRARQLTRVLTDKEFNEFKVKDLDLYFVCMTPYDETFKNVEVAYKKESPKNTFGEYISKLGYKQLRIAETEKYAHVTFFFNGGVEEEFDGEDRILVPSPKVATYDLQPEMSVPIVRDKVLEAIDTDKYNAIVLNFANTDMVGHTGKLDAAIKAVESVDEAIGKIYKKILEKNGTLLITADHGNCEKMFDYVTHEPHTAHTTNLVPLIVVGKDVKLKSGRLCDLAPTMLEIMGLDKPEEMTGESLIVKWF